jgi:hypothetical protein
VVGVFGVGGQNGGQSSVSVGLSVLVKSPGGIVKIPVGRAVLVAGSKMPPGGIVKGRAVLVGGHGGTCRSGKGNG